MLSLLILILFLSWATPASAQSIDSFAELSAFLKRSRPKDASTILAEISPEMRKNFALVYESRSPHAASLDRPRIIMTSPAGDFLMGISPPNGEKNPGGIIEMIDLEEGTPRFQRIDFSSGSFAFSKNTPRSCAGCHSKIEEGEVSRIFRPIWDGYPDWPGVLGTSHNGLVMKKKGKYGTSGFKELEFETDALKKIQLSQGDTIYSFLPDLADATLFELSEKLTEMTTLMLSFQSKSILKYIQSRIELLRPSELEQLRTLLKNRNIVLESDQKRISELNKRQAEYYDKKLSRLVQVVEKYGTLNDKKMIASAAKYKKLSFDGTSGYAQFGRPERWRLEERQLIVRYFAAMEFLGVDVDLLGINREVGTWFTSDGTNSLRTAIEAYSWIEGFAKFPQIGLSCKTVLNHPTQTSDD